MTYHEQQKSKLPKKGSEGSHRKAQDRLVNLLMDSGWEVFPDSSLHVTGALRSDMSIRLDHDSDYYHEFDIYATKEHNNGLKSEIIIEIDGSSHNSKPQKGRDKTAQEYAAFFLPNCVFKRIPIGEILGDVSTEELVTFYRLR